MDNKLKRRGLLSKAAGVSVRSGIIHYGFIVRIIGSEVSDDEYLQMERDAEAARAEVAAKGKPKYDIRDLGSSLEYAKLYEKYCHDGGVLRRHVEELIKMREVK